MKRYASLAIEITKMISAFIIATGVAYQANKAEVAIFNLLIVETAAFLIALSCSIALTIFNK